MQASNRYRELYIYWLGYLLTATVIVFGNYSSPIDIMFTGFPLLNDCSLIFWFYSHILYIGRPRNPYQYWLVSVITIPT